MRFTQNGKPLSIDSIESSTLPLVRVFGCGNGFLVRYLRQAGKEAYGIELASERVNGKMYPEIEQYLIMYDGNFPMPYAVQSFDYVIATEVLEHMEKLDGMLAECSRVARKGLLVSVPDMSSI